MARLEGTRLGAYEIIERIGSGGMAEVYRAKQRTAFDREVAIKVIRKGYADDEEFRARFLREARVISQLSHLNILPLIESGEGGEHGEILFLVMPFIAGGTLRDRIKKQGGPLPIRETIRIFTQLCEAIDHAHQHGVIHRDIKPSNVLLQDGRNVLLADFGIALDTGDARLTSTGMGLGTAEYMAPEQAKGQADRRSDVYSLGVVLYVMLTGQVPYTGSTPFDVLLKHATEPLPPLRSMNPDVPEKIEEVVQTAMAKEPANRFQSAQALLNAFESAVLELGPQALASMQWSGAVLAVRSPGSTALPGTGTPPSHPPASTPSGPSGTPAGSGPHSGPSQPSSPGAVSGAQASSAIEDLPTQRRTAFEEDGPAGQSASGSSAAGRATDPEVSTLITSNEATGLTNVEATHLAPASEGQASATPPPAPDTPPGVVPPAPPAKRWNTAVIAALIALVVVLLGGSALGTSLLLSAKSQPGTGNQPTVSSTPGVLTFIPNTACSQKADNPTQPAKQPVKYLPPIVSDQGKGAPAFVAVHYDGTLYYTDVAGQGIYSYSPALAGHPEGHRYTNLIQPSGIAITPDPAARIYYLQHSLDSSGKLVERLMRVNDSGVSSQLATLPGVPAGKPANFSLALNPVNNALLVPDGANGVIYCFSQSTLQASPAVTGLQRPVAAVVDQSGNMYIADQGANTIMRFSPTGGAPDWKQPFAAPADLAFDQGGYLLATLQGTRPGDGQVVRIDPATGKLVDTLMSGLQQPLGITFDTGRYHTGTVYFVDQAANVIYAMCTQHNGICP